MTYKTILVHMDGHARNAHTLQLACNVAGKFDAHLAAVYALKQSSVAAAMDVGTGVLLANQADPGQQLLTTAQGMVADAEQRSGRMIEWRSAHGSAAYNVILHARHADLLVLTQEDVEQKTGNDSSFAGNVVVATGRPVLMVPYVGDFPGCGSSVLIAWSGTRESARAVADALPILKQAKLINVVSFNPKGNAEWGDIPGADIGLWLTRHGVRVNVRQQKSDDVDVGNQILSLAADLGVDLIVMGAYGHSRTYEFVLGGVTRTLLETMTVPVLMSH